VDDISQLVSRKFNCIPKDPQTIAAPTTSEFKYIVVDFRYKDPSATDRPQYGRVYTGPPVDGKADATNKMSLEVFDRLARKELSGF
jgi:hypothetical protein